jgi:hypothetical protein
MFILLLLFLFSGIFLAGISIPLILGKIPPNGLYGFRVKKTMENPEIWYLVNAYSGKWLLVVGIVLAIVSIVLYFIPGFSIILYSYSILAIWAVLFAIALAASIRYLKTL